MVIKYWEKYIEVRNRKRNKIDKYRGRKVKISIDKKIRKNEIIKYKKSINDIN
jgi:hypothetical protein